MSNDALDHVDTAPVLSFPNGRAWKINTKALREKLNIDPADDATLAYWIVEAPWAHPFWHSYAIILVHLRPMPKGGDTVFHLEGATHEIWVYALAPEGSRDRLIQGGRPGHDGAPTYLTPLNFAAQFIEVEDHHAVARVERAVRAICEGNLSPDTDYIRDWGVLFGTNMMKEGAGETRVKFNVGGAATEIVIPPKPPKDWSKP